MRAISTCAVAVGTWVATLAASWAGAVIKEGDSWRYFVGVSTPTSNWTQVGFGDGLWAQGPSGFGFGDSDDATTPAGMSGSQVSLYTRRTFTIADTSTVTHLTLGADYDDGFVAYINGTEVSRVNLPAGPISNTSTASANHEASRAGEVDYRTGASPQEKEFITLPPGVLVNGTNVLAVSGHNISQSSSDFSLIIELYTNVTLVRGPILQMPEPGRISVMWRTDALTDSVVDYGEDASYGAGAVTNAGLVRNHLVDLPVLAAGTTFHYRVRSSGVVLATNIFRAPVSSAQAFRFAAIGDFGSPTTNTAAVASRVAAAQVDFVCSVGDNIYQDGQPGSFDAHWFRPYSNVNARAPVFSALGNHDVNTASGGWTLVNFAFPANGPASLLERNYSFDYGNAHVVVLDSNSFDDDATVVYSAFTGGSVRDVIKGWLTNDLAATTQAWKFVFYHHPGRTSAGSHGDEALVQSELEPIIGKYGVDIVFQGHNHWYERINPINGVHYITTGGGGFSLHSVSGSPQPYSATLYNASYSYSLVDVNGLSLSLQCIDQAGNVRDTFLYDKSEPFDMDGLVDSMTWGRATNQGLRLYAAIRKNVLYLATQDAGVNDHFIYLNNTQAALTAANWGKSGQIMQWSAFLGDESVNGFKSWFGPAQAQLTDPAIYRAQSSGLNNNGTNGNGVIEGSLNLVAHFGTFPTQVWAAIGPYPTADGGSLLYDYQVPLGNNDGNLDPNEFLAMKTRDLALDLPVAEAGSDATTEAGMWAALDGSQSSAPSGLPLIYAWSQVTGPVGVFSNANAALASFRLDQAIASATTLVLRLTVNDTRFDSNDTRQVTFVPMLDTDGDGLSDQEELTGQNNLFTSADPAGATSNYQNVDSDQDGMWDGAEAVAGTDRNNASSLLKVVDSTSEPDGAHVVVRWSSVTGRLYAVHQTTNLVDTFTPVISNVPASDPVNSFTATVNGAEHLFFKIEAQQ